MKKFFVVAAILTLILIAYNYSPVTSGVISCALVVAGSGGSFSGKLGNMVYNKNGIVRAWASPVQPDSDSQVNHRADFGAISSGWVALSNAVQNAFKTLGDSVTRFRRNGSSYHPSGRQIYQELSTNLNTIGQPMLDAAPTLGTVDPVPLIDTGTTNLSVAHGLDVELQTGIPTGYVGRVFATGNARAGIAFSKGFRFIGLIPEGDDAATFEAEYDAVFGTPTLDMRYKIRVDMVNKDTGQAATPRQFSAVVVA